MWKSFLKFLGAEEAEFEKVSLLLGMGFFMGVFLAAYQIGAEVLFLKTKGLGEEYLDYAFFAAGFLGIVSTILFVYFQKRIPFKRLVTTQLFIITVFLLSISALLIYAEGLEETSFQNHAIVFTSFVALGPIIALILLGFWGTFNRMFDLRASKRIIGGIDTGQLTATIIAFFAIGLIPENLYNTANLIFISAGSVTLTLVFLILIVRKFDLDQMAGHEKSSEARESGYADLFKNRYLKYLSLFLIVSMIATQFMEFTFLNTVNTFYPEETELKTYLAFFSGLVMIVSFIIQTFINDIIIGTYGLKVSLLVMPAVLALFTIGAAISGNVFGYDVKNDELIYFFLFVSLGRLFSAAFKDALESPAFKLFFLPLDINVRFDIQTKIEGVVSEFSALIAGTLLVILGLDYFNFFKLINYTYVILGLVIVLYFITSKLYLAYRKSLQDTLNKNKKATTKLNSERKIIPHILEKSESDNPSQSIYALKVLEKVDPVLLEKTLRKKLDDPSPKIREYAIERLQEIKSLDSLEILKKKTSSGSLSASKELALKAIDELSSIEGFKMSTEKLKELVRSTNSADRVFASKVLLRLEDEEHVPFLTELLRDINPEVRSSAITTVGKLGRREFWGYLVDNLSSPQYCNSALSAIVKIGEPILPFLESHFNKSGTGIQTKVRITQIYGRIGGEEAASLLWKRIDTLEKDVFSQVLYSLDEMGYRAHEYQAARIKITIESDIEDSIWNLSALREIPKEPQNELIRTALKEEVRHNFDHIFMLLSMNYDPESIQLVKENIESGDSDKVTFALELLDTFITEDLKPKLFPLLDDISILDKVKKLDEFYAPETFSSFVDVCRKLVNRDFNRINRWTKALALYYLRDLVNENENDLQYLVAYLFHTDLLLRQTAASSLYKISPSLYEEHTSRLEEEVKKSLDRAIVPPAFLRDQIYHEHLKVERVNMLSEIGVFKELPGVVVAEMEDYVEEFEVEKGLRIINQGDSGTPLYVILKGSLDVNVDEKRVARIGENELIGESYITQNDQNKASFVSSEKCILLKLDKDKFYELTSKNYQIVDGLFTILNQKTEEVS